MCDTDDDLPQGARSAGRLESAPPSTRLFVWALRRWMDGACGQQAVWNHFAEHLGPRDSHRAMGGFERLICAVAAAHRRVLHRHETRCSCIGVDEQMLARLVVAAAQGEREIALAAACSFASPAGAAEIVASAARFGFFLLKVGDAPQAALEQAVFPPPERSPENRTVH